MDANGTTQQQSNIETLQGKQVCSISISCVVDTDDEGIAIKKRIVEALAGVKFQRVQFTLLPVPQRGMPELPI